MITDEDTYILQVYILDKLNSSTELNTLHAILQITFNFNSRIAIYGVAQQNRKKNHREIHVLQCREAYHNL